MFKRVCCVNSIHVRLYTVTYCILTLLCLPECSCYFGKCVCVCVCGGGDVLCLLLLARRSLGSDACCALDILKLTELSLSLFLLSLHPNSSFISSFISFYCISFFILLCFCPTSSSVLFKKQILSFSPPQITVLSCYRFLSLSILFSPRVLVAMLRRACALCACVCTCVCVLHCSAIRYHLCVRLLCSGGDTGLAEITSVYVPLALSPSTLSPARFLCPSLPVCLSKLDLQQIVVLLVISPHIRCHMGRAEQQ